MMMRRKRKDMWAAVFWKKTFAWTFTKIQRLARHLGHCGLRGMRWTSSHKFPLDPVGSSLCSRNRSAQPNDLFSRDLAMGPWEVRQRLGLVTIGKIRTNQFFRKSDASFTSCQLRKSLLNIHAFDGVEIVVCLVSKFWATLSYSSHVLTHRRFIRPCCPSVPDSKKNYNEGFDSALQQLYSIRHTCYTVTHAWLHNVFARFIGSNMAAKAKQSPSKIRRMNWNIALLHTIS